MRYQVAYELVCQMACELNYVVAWELVHKVEEACDINWASL